jgi:chorismate mutase
MNVIAVRGAVALEETGDESSLMVEALGDLIDSLEDRNGFSAEDIVSIHLTQTSDLKKKNAAAALREGRPAYNNVPLFCAREPEVENSLPRTLRLLVTWRGTGPAVPVYSGAASSLRPDLSSGNDS